MSFSDIRKVSSGSGDISNFFKSTLLIVLENGAQKKDEDPSSDFLKILDMRSISIRKHGMTI